MGYNGNCNGNTIADCVIRGNGSYGIHGTGGNGGRCNGNMITRCTISANGNWGIYLIGLSGECSGNTIAGCVIRANSGCGIYFTYANGKTLLGNHITGQTGHPSYGIWCDTTARNLIVRNSCVGQVNNFAMTANDTYGPIVTASGELAATGTSAHAWAIFHVEHSTGTTMKV